MPDPPDCEEVSVDWARVGTRSATAGIRPDRGRDEVLSCLAATARMKAGVIAVVLLFIDMLYESPLLVPQWLTMVTITKWTVSLLTE